jgi:hypothetical protein
MPIQSKLYAVSTGCYSDYTVRAIFSNREKAQAFIDAVPYNDYNDIEEYDLDPPTVARLKRGESVWVVWMLRDSTAEKVWRTKIELYNVTDPPSHRLWERSKAPAYKGKGVQDCLVSTVWAKTEKQAVKVANEHRVQMIANGEWNA